MNQKSDLEDQIEEEQSAFDDHRNNNADEIQKQKLNTAA